MLEPLREETRPRAIGRPRCRRSRYARTRSMALAALASTWAALAAVRRPRSTNRAPPMRATRAPCRSEYILADPRRRCATFVSGRTCRSSGGSCSNLRRSTRWSSGVQGQSDCQGGARGAGSGTRTGRAQRASLSTVAAGFRPSVSKWPATTHKLSSASRPTAITRAPCSRCALYYSFHGAAQRWIRA